MSQAVIGALRVNLGLNSAEFTNGLNRARGSLNQFGRFARQGAVAAAAGIAAASTAMGVLTARSIAANHELRTLATLSGSTQADLRNMAIATRDYGIEQSKLADILKDTRDRVGDFLETGGGPMADYFENIAPLVGQTAEQFRNLSGRDALQLYYDGLEQANLGQNEMTFYLEAIASDATALIPVLANGGEAIRRMAEENERLNITLSETESVALEEARQSMQRIKDVMEGVGNSIAVEVAPYLQAAADYIYDMALEAGGFQSAIGRAFDVGWTAAGRALDMFHRVRIVMKQLNVLGGMVRQTFYGIAEAVSSAIGGSISAVNDWIDRRNAGEFTIHGGPPIIQLDRIPGADAFESLGDRARQGMQAATEGLAEDRAELAALMETPLPSNELAEALAEVRARLAENSNPAPVDRTGNMPTGAAGRGGGGGAGGGGGRSAANDLAREAARIAESQQRIMQDLRRQAQDAAMAVQNIGMDPEDLRSFELTRDTLRQLRDQGVEIGPAVQRSVEQMSEAIAASEAEFQRLSDQQREYQQAVEGWSEDLKGGLIDAIVEGENLGDVFENLAKQIAKAALEAALFGSGPLAGGGGGEGFGGLVGAIISGFRADGGPVGMGKSYIVGERGPELFTPGASGFITPNEVLSSSPGVSGGGDVIINNYGPPVRAEKRETSRGFEVDLFHDMADEYMRGPRGRKTMEQVYGNRSRPAVGV